MILYTISDCNGSPRRSSHYTCHPDLFVKRQSSSCHPYSNGNGTSQLLRSRDLVALGVRRQSEPNGAGPPVARPRRTLIVTNGYSVSLRIAFVSSRFLADYEVTQPKLFPLESNGDPSWSLSLTCAFFCARVTLSVATVLSCAQSENPRWHISCIPHIVNFLNTKTGVVDF